MIYYKKLKCKERSEFRQFRSKSNQIKNFASPPPQQSTWTIPTATGLGELYTVPEAIPSLSLSWSQDC